MLLVINTNLKKSTHNIVNLHTLFTIILNKPRLKKMDQNSLYSPLLSVHKDHPILRKVKIQNVHPCFLNDKFPNQGTLTP
jgi:hypothetical protein